MHTNYEYIYTWKRSHTLATSFSVILSTWLILYRFHTEDMAYLIWLVHGFYCIIFAYVDICMKVVCMTDKHILSFVIRVLNHSCDLDFDRGSEGCYDDETKSFSNFSKLTGMKLDRVQEILSAFLL